MTIKQVVKKLEAIGETRLVKVIQSLKKPRITRTDQNEWWIGVADDNKGIEFGISIHLY